MHSENNSVTCGPISPWIPFGPISPLSPVHNQKFWHGLKLQRIAYASPFSPCGPIAPTGPTGP